MNDRNYDAIVIGSGPGGSSCATLLQKRGLEVLLLEKNAFTGGKMVSIEKDGYAYDLFPHGQVPMRGAAFEQVFAELGISDEFQPALQPDDDRDVLRIAYRKRGWSDYRIAKLGQSMADPAPFFAVWDIDAEAQAKAIAFMTEMVGLSEEEIDHFCHEGRQDPRRGDPLHVQSLLL